MNFLKFLLNHSVVGIWSSTFFAIVDSGAVSIFINSFFPWSNYFLREGSQESFYWVKGLQDFMLGSAIILFRRLVCSRGGSFFRMVSSAGLLNFGGFSREKLIYCQVHTQFSAFVICLSWNSVCLLRI